MSVSALMRSPYDSLLASSFENCAPAASVCESDARQLACASNVSRTVRRKSGAWFCSMRSSSRDAPASTRIASPTGQATDSDVVAFSKSWSTGVRKKSEYSDVPSARQCRSATSAGPTSARTCADALRLS